MSLDLTFFYPLQLLIGGISEIDVDDWEKYTDYRGYKSDDEVVQWFWKTVKTWPIEKKSRLLQFTTGTSRTPVNGFRDLQGSDGPRRFTVSLVFYRIMIVVLIISSHSDWEKWIRKCFAQDSYLLQSIRSSTLQIYWNVSDALFPLSPLPRSDS